MPCWTTSWPPVCSMRRAMPYPGRGSHVFEGLPNHQGHSPLPDAIVAHAISYREPIGMYTLTYWEAIGERNEMVRTGLAARRLGKGWFIEHPMGIREITGLTLTTPVPLRSLASRKVIGSGIIAARIRPTPLLEIEFGG